MPERTTRQLTRSAPVPLLLSTLIVLALLGIGWYAPTETTMGHVQRIVYIHVAVAWFGLWGLIATAACGLLYLLRRQLNWDHWAQAFAELGWICAGLTLVTGSMWARAAWGTWWTWEPRLTTAFIMWCIYGGYLIARQNIEDTARRARLSAILAIAGALDVPLVILATRLFRGMHPVSPTMDPAMRIVLWLSIISFTAFFCWLTAHRRTQLQQQEQLDRLESRRMRRADEVAPEPVLKYVGQIDA
jgi:heme exporter protein C